jgi:hypothetical protein
MFLSRARPRVPVLAALLVLAGCGEEVVVRESTRVYRDGSLSRSIEISGREADGSTPTDAAWLAETAGVALASPDAWGRIDERPGYLAAEATFARADGVPRILTHAGEKGSVLDRTRIDLRDDDLVVMRRWIYEEVRGDPYGAEELAAAVDAMVELAVDYLREEVRKEFGSGMATARAETFLRRDVRSLALDVFGLMRQTLGSEDDPAAMAALLEILARHDVRRPGGDPPSSDDDLFDVAAPPVMTWMLDGLATALSTADAPVAPEDLDFWPTLEDLSTLEISDQPQADPRVEAFTRAAEVLLDALSGYYGNEGSPRFRFESHIEMPGRLLRTNGTPGTDGVHWLYRNVDLALGDVTMTAETVELDLDALVALGARRDFDTAALLRLTDLLATRDTEAVVRELLAAAVETGRLDLLIDEERVPDELERLARELHELLDPSREPWPGAS